MLHNYYQFAKQHSAFLGFGLITAFFGNYGQSFFIAWFGKSFQADFNLSSAAYGSVYSAATLISGFIMLYVGALLDKVSLKQFSLFTCLGLTLACIGLSFSQAIWQLLIALLLLRLCGQGLMFHIANASMARYFESNRGKAIGIVSIGMPLGEALLPAVAVALIASVGWRNTWLLLGIILPLIYLPLMIQLINRSTYLFSRFLNKDDDSTIKNLSGWTRSQVVKDWQFWRLIPAVMSPAFIITGLLIHQAELLQTKSWSEAWFASCFTLFAVSHLLSSFTVGELVDRFGSTRIMHYYLLPLLTAVGLLMLPLHHPFIALLCMLLLGATVGASGPTVGALWVELYGNKHIGAIRSLVTAIMVVSTSIAPIFMGYLFDLGYSYQQVIALLLVYLLAAMALAFKIKRRKINV